IQVSVRLHLTNKKPEPDSGFVKLSAISFRQYFPTSRQHAEFAAVLPHTVSAFYLHPVSPPA
ncbi:hypothetical protein ECEC1736_3042, partial [Escherichia coli EC1736]